MTETGYHPPLRARQATDVPKPPWDSIISEARGAVAASAERTARNQWNQRALEINTPTELPENCMWVKCENCGRQWIVTPKALAGDYCPECNSAGAIANGRGSKLYPMDGLHPAGNGGAL